MGGCFGSRRNKNAYDEWFNAAKKGSVDDIKQIYLRIGDINKSDDQGMTALHYAIEVNKMELIDWLLANGVKMNKLNKEYKTPLLMATEKGNSVLVEKLVRRGIELQTKRKRSCPIQQPIHAAVKKGHLDILYYLLEHGAEANIAGPDGQTALNLARRDNQKDAERILLKYINR